MEKLTRPYIACEPELYEFVYSRSLSALLREVADFLDRLEGRVHIWDMVIEKTGIPNDDVIDEEDAWSVRLYIQRLPD